MSGMYLVLGPMGGQTPGCRLCGMPVTAHRSTCSRSPGVLKTLRQKLDAERAVDVVMPTTVTARPDLADHRPKADEPLEGWERDGTWQIYQKGGVTVWRGAGVWWRSLSGQPAEIHFPTMHEAMRFAEAAMAPTATAFALKDTKPEAEGADRDGWSLCKENGPGGCVEYGEGRYHVWPEKEKWRANLVNTWHETQLEAQKVVEGLL